MQIHSKLTGTRGFVSAYNNALRFRYMITPHVEECARILAFWQKHGDAATKEAFRVSRATLFRWQKALKEGGGKLESLVPGSTEETNVASRGNDILGRVVNLNFEF